MANYRRIIDNLASGVRVDGAVLAELIGPAEERVREMLLAWHARSRNNTSVKGCFCAVWWRYPIAALAAATTVDFGQKMTP